MQTVKVFCNDSTNSFQIATPTCETFATAQRQHLQLHNMVSIRLTELMPAHPAVSETPDADEPRHRSTYLPLPRDIGTWGLWNN